MSLKSLCRAALNKIGIGPRYGADPDHYHGDTAKGYLAKRLKQEHWHKEQEIVQNLLNDVPDGARVLDVPVGTGRFVEMYLAKKMAVYGIDISSDMLDAAREALGPAYDQCDMRRGSADELPYDDESFDLIVCFRFFGLISLDMGHRVLAELHRVCKGPVIIRVPVRKASAPPMPPLKGSEAVQGRMYENEVRDMFSTYGFDIVDKRLINERTDVEFIVYLLQKRTSTNVIREDNKR